MEMVAACTALSPRGERSNWKRERERETDKVMGVVLATV